MTKREEILKKLQEVEIEKEELFLDGEQLKDLLPMEKDLVFLSIEYKDGDRQMFIMEEEQAVSILKVAGRFISGNESVWISIGLTEKHNDLSAKEVLKSFKGAVRLDNTIRSIRVVNSESLSETLSGLSKD